MLESYGAARAATRITASQLDELDMSCEALAALPVGSAAESADENRRFHYCIMAAADSERLLFLVQTLLQVPLAYKREFWSHPEYQTAVVNAHRRIAAALRARDSEAAAEEIRRHLEEVSEPSILQGVARVKSGRRKRAVTSR